MHPEQAALLETVLHRPEDDAPRLIYADWLEETGRDALAAFIRQGVQSGRRRASFRVPREYTLPAGVSAFTSRGMICHVALECDAFLKYAAELFGRHPITSVRIRDREPVRLQVTPRVVRWAWRHGLDEVREDPARLPSPLSVLRPVCVDGEVNGPMRRFMTAAAAHVGLSVACVNYGRRAAGLKRLPMRHHTSPV
jgi:uncharacterized protein (TIGR02996 family)